MLFSVVAATKITCLIRNIFEFVCYANGNFNFNRMKISLTADEEVSTKTT